MWIADMLYCLGNNDKIQICICSKVGEHGFQIQMLKSIDVELTDAELQDKKGWLSYNLCRKQKGSD
jgi:hypothetical protein